MVTDPFKNVTHWAFKNKTTEDILPHAGHLELKTLSSVKYLMSFGRDFKSILNK